MTTVRQYQAQDEKAFRGIATENHIEQESRLVGFVCLQFEDNYVFMSDLFVIRENRNQGVGALLTEKLEARASLKGATHIALRVEAEKTNARDFYKNKQYQEKFVVMQKTLSD